MLRVGLGWWVWGTLTGCGPDLAGLEIEQQSLEQEVAVLREQVTEMRTRLKAMGMLPRGPEATGWDAPDSSLEGVLSVEVERTGSLPVLPPLGAPERRKATPCGWRFFAPYLDAVSDLTLDRTGSGRSSPVVLLHDGVALRPHATVPQFERECGGAFRVQPRYIFFSPAAPDAVGGTWSLSVADALPWPRGGDGRGTYWVYPGTTMTFTVGGWKDEWGPFEVRLDARLLEVGTPDQPRRPARAPAEVEWLGERVTGLDGRLGFERAPDAPNGPWTLTVRSPEDGPWVLLEALVIGNDGHALVVAETAP